MAKSELYELPHKVKDYHGNKRLAGAYVPRQLVNEVDLVALYRNTSRSSLIEEQLTNLVETEQPVDAIIRILANRAFQEWSKRLNQNKGKHAHWREHDQLIRRKNDFIQEVMMRLRKRKITEHHVNSIIDQFKYLIGENNGTTD